MANGVSAGAAAASGSQAGARADEWRLQQQFDLLALAGREWRRSRAARDLRDDDDEDENDELGFDDDDDSSTFNAADWYDAFDDV